VPWRWLRFRTDRVECGIGHGGLGGVGAHQPLSQLGYIAQAPPIGHPLTPHERIGIDATTIEGSDELP
jgi:hypothetical protein